MRAARAGAVLEGRDYVTPDDVKARAPSVLRHRVDAVAGARGRRTVGGRRAGRRSSRASRRRRDDVRAPRSRDRCARDGRCGRRSRRDGSRRSSLGARRCSGCFPGSAGRMRSRRARSLRSSLPSRSTTSLLPPPSRSRRRARRFPRRWASATRLRRRYIARARAGRGPARVQLFDAVPAGDRGGVDDASRSADRRDGAARRRAVRASARGPIRVSARRAALDDAARTRRADRAFRFARRRSYWWCRRSPTCGGSGCSRCSIGSATPACARSSGAAKGKRSPDLRDYVPGDDPRIVDWKATARHARLITREQTVERSQTVITLVDCGRAMTQLAGRLLALRARAVGGAACSATSRPTSGDRVGTARVRRPDPRVRSAAARDAARCSSSRSR